MKQKTRLSIRKSTSRKSRSRTSRKSRLRKSTSRKSRLRKSTSRKSRLRKSTSRKSRSISQKSRSKKSVNKSRKTSRTSKSISTPVNGLYIGNNVVEKISGPIGMYYLDPSRSSKHNYYRPPILLFGDEHFSYKNMCKPCKKTENCYSISDPSFYKLFDKKEYGVDMYIEVFANEDLHMTPHQKGFSGGVMYDLIRETKQCFPIYRVFSKRQCPTKYIKYHAADSRFGTMPTESTIKRTLTIENTIHKVLKKRNFFNKNNNDEQMSIAKQLLKNAFEESFLGNRYISLNTHQFVDDFFDVINHRNSLIGKQLVKQLPYFDREFWKDVFVYHIDNNDMGQLEINKKTFDLYVDGLLDKKTIENIRSKFYVKFTIFLNVIMDLYTLLRMFKKRDAKDISYFTIAYFGDNHSKSIMHILVDFFGYDIKYYNDNDNDNDTQYYNPNRCITITKPIDINKDIAEAQESYKKFNL